MMLISLRVARMRIRSPAAMALIRWMVAKVLIRLLVVRMLTRCLARRAPICLQAMPAMTR